MSDKLRTTLELKQVDAGQRLITGWAAVAGNVDLGLDEIQPKALQAAAQGDPSKLGVFVGHNTASLPVGICTAMSFDGKGLVTTTRIFPTTAGDDLLATAKALMAAGQTLGLSIGYRIPPGGASYERRGSKTVRLLSALDIAEFSFASAHFVMNPEALVTGVKAGKTGAPGSFDAARMALMSTLREQFRDAWAEIEDIYADRVIYSLTGSGGLGREYYQASYTLDGQGHATLGEPVEVAPNWSAKAMGSGSMPDMGQHDKPGGGSHMPYEVRKHGDQFCVHNQSTGKQIHCFPTRDAAMAQMRALYANEPAAAGKTETSMNDLPDSAFLYVEEGGSLDHEQKTVPRSNRHLPYRNAEGAIELGQLQTVLEALPDEQAAGLDAEMKTVFQARIRRMADQILAGKTVEDSAPEWQHGAAVQVRAIGYGLLDASETIAAELKAMSLLGSDTKANGRLRPELRQTLADLAGELSRLVEHAELIDREQDGAAKVAHYRRTLELLEV